MKIDTTQMPRTQAATSSPEVKSKQRVETPELLASRQETSPAQRVSSSPEMQIARGGDSLEISAAGRALLEESLSRSHEPGAEAKNAQTAAQKANPTAQEKTAPGEVPNLLVAKR